jgi:hypothetical protein
VPAQLDDLHITGDFCRLNALMTEHCTACLAVCFESSGERGVRSASAMVAVAPLKPRLEVVTGW